MTRKMSYSQMALFNECHRKWYNNYILKIGTYTPEAFVFGREVHKALEKRIASKVDYGFKETNKTGLAQQLVNAGIDKLEEIFGSNWMNYTTPENVEVTLQTPIFKGIIDLLLVDDKALHHLIDWKTTSNEDDYNDHRIKTDEQLTSYCWLCHQALGFLPDKVMFITLNKKTGFATAYETERTMEDVKEFEKKINTTHWNANNNQPNDKNPSGCINKWGKCEYYDRCWKGAKVKVYEHKLPSLF